MYPKFQSQASYQDQDSDSDITINTLILPRSYLSAWGNWKLWCSLFVLRMKQLAPFAWKLEQITIQAVSKSLVPSSFDSN